MEIKITLMAILRRPNDIPRVFTEKIEKGLNLKSFLKNLGYSDQEIQMMQVFVTNIEGKNQRVSFDYALQNKDELYITVPVGGG